MTTRMRAYDSFVHRDIHNVSRIFEIVKSFEIKNVMRLRRDDVFEDEGNRDKLFTFARLVPLF